MLALVEITPWHYAGFILCVLFFLALDLGVFHREAHVVKFKEALGWTSLWFTLAMLFAFGLRFTRGPQVSLEFVTGYLIELSLSMDNVFVIALIFSYFRVPPQYQHRVLFWGIMGALVMRGVMIWAGAALIQRFQWTLYLFGIFLVFTGIKMLFASDDGVHPEKNPVVKLARKMFPITADFNGQHFTIRTAAGLALTPLALVLILVETTDLIFALDSIPAIFAVTTDAFVVFTSNVFAILGLRSLYFVLAGAIGLFRYLKYGLSIVLVFIGVKMLIDPHQPPGVPAEHFWQYKIPIGLSLAVVVGIIVGSILLSLAAARRDRARGGDSNAANS
jgi:tellurite resistance protein TerC